VAPDVETQTEQALRNVQAILEAAGSDLAHVIRCGVFLIDMAEFPKMNAVYARMFGGHRPARTTVQVAGLPGPGLRVEIDAVAQHGHTETRKDTEGTEEHGHTETRKDTEGTEEHGSTEGTEVHGKEGRRRAMIPIIEEAALREAMTTARAVDVIRDAFRADGEGRTLVPTVINLEIPGAHGEFHVKTAHITGVPHIAVKIASGFYDNPARGLPSGSGLMVVLDASTGLPAALLLDNGFLTDLRTGAAGAVAAGVLACRAIGTVGVIGSGVQARVQVQCLRVVRAFTRLVCWSPTRQHLERYCREMRADGYDAQPASGPEAVCRAADVLITATPARAPIVRAEWLHEGLHVTAVGSDTPGKQELDAACLARADLVAVDRLAQCAAFGELRHALEGALLTRENVRELGSIVAHREPGRTRDDEITIADLTGVGFQDTAIASEAYAACVRGQP